MFSSALFALALTTGGHPPDDLSAPPPLPQQTLSVRSSGGWSPAQPSPGPTGPPSARTPTTAELVEGLDAELNQVELALIAGEIRRLRESGRFDADTLDRIADLRQSLADIRARLRPAPRPARTSAAPVLRGCAPASLYTPGTAAPVGSPVSNTP